MRIIYPYARRTITWLRPEANNCKLALSMIEHFAEQTVFGKSFWEDALDAAHAHWPEPDCVFPYNKATWTSQQSVFPRTWFDPTLDASGGFDLQPQSDPAMRQLINPLLFAHESNTDMASHAVVPTRSHIEVQQPGFARNRLSSDPRDKIFGISGLLSPQIVAKIAPDYTKPHQQIYKEATFAYIKNSKQLQLLEHCGLIHGEGSGSSWGADLSKKGLALGKAGINR
ncbi:hypothetical protein BJ878DRAFT_562363 [Calycina marina]|uniref:Uncharacterized protein n=1 Tax=Calycina marina TaxID=1763456 RepID=A0A9P7YUA3_9HELO|nr:hypothetical protein BJ878DRAFT_562363 [Calycina marina]